MKLTTKTLDVLKNFSTFSNGILVNPGNMLKVISVDETSAAQAFVDVEFPQQFAISNLSEFISTVKLFKDPLLTFDEDHLILSEGKYKQKYYYANKRIIISNRSEELYINKFREIQPEITFNLSKEDLDMIQKAASVSNGTHVVFESHSNKFFVKSTQISKREGETDRFSDFSIQLEDLKFDEEFKYALDKSLLKVLPLDYSVGIFKGKSVIFKNEDYNVEYRLALEA